ncbi:EscU/YscU/HrcU family type III secretion system export apparatus switch protein [Methylocapsa sp. S129]|uniref:EscU/YscU/HrcU family type III secretion system export apparatus switch protein n=1 Tax=Methylocapsa sp. S129 TaxID=1641869 RepID=UPI00131C5EE4|nr:EscU/YscU/HrcU family type III secretion system export apparatus switch protein [Methylocapsa sp. S129]
MSEETDKESQTENATEKKLNDSMERGDVPMSREVALVTSLACILVSMIFLLRDGAQRLVAALVLFLDDSGQLRLERVDDVMALYKMLVSDALSFLAPIIALLIVGGVVASMAQNAPRFVLERIQPDLGRLSLIKGFSRTFGLKGLTEFLKSILKLGAVGAIVAMVLSGERVSLVNAMYMDIGDLPELILGDAIRLLAAVVVATLVIAAADVVWSRIHWRRDHRMSRHEIKEEIRQTEGDRMLKARLRSIRLDRSRRRMLAGVPKATMVIVNPTHYAVALRYVRSEGGVPMVVAKGQDLIALKIREIAEQNDIPLIEDKALARSLYEVVSVDSMIPAEFYRTIAEVIHLIQTKKSNWPIVRHGQRA